MWQWAQIIAFLAGAVLMALYILFWLVYGLSDIFDFFRFYYRLFSGTISLREMRDDYKNRR